MALLAIQANRVMTSSRCRTSFSSNIVLFSPMTILFLVLLLKLRTHANHRLTAYSFLSPSFDSGSGDSLWRWSFRFLRRVEKEKREDQMSVWCYRVGGLLDFGGPRTVTQRPNPNRLGIGSQGYLTLHSKGRRELSLCSGPWRVKSRSEAVINLFYSYNS